MDRTEKQLLVEHIPFYAAKISLQEGLATSGLMRVRGKLQEAEVQNGNGRVYPREVLIKEIEKYNQEKVQQRIAMGELDHPDSQIVELKNASHIITKIWWEGNDVMGELELLNTPSGKIAQAIVEAGIPLGISSRAMGSVKQIGEIVQVQDDLDLLCWDLVSVPSTPKAYMNLAEGLNANSKRSEDKYLKVNQLITEIICNATGVCTLC